MRGFIKEAMKGGERLNYLANPLRTKPASNLSTGKYILTNLPNIASAGTSAANLFPGAGSTAKLLTELGIRAASKDYRNYEMTKALNGSSLLDKLSPTRPLVLRDLNKILRPSVTPDTQASLTQFLPKV